MCDFHSVIVDGAGKIYHLPSNSHSGIAAHHNLNNDELSAPFWECEWDGVGEQPVELCQHRHQMKHEPTALAVSAVDRHYALLAKVLWGEVPVDECSYPFNTADYSDVPARIKWAKAETEQRAEHARATAKRKAEDDLAVKLASTMFEVFGEKLESLPDRAMIIAIRKFVEESSVSMEEVADKEIEWGREDYIHRDSAYNYVLSDGEYYHQDDCVANEDLNDYVRDSNEYYTQEQLDEAIDEAKTEWVKEAISAIENVG
jgi:hypothetical protein